MKINPNEARITALLDQFVADADKAVGKTSGKARFYGFQLSDGLKSAFSEALDHFRLGEFNNAELSLKKASDWLDRSQRKFCANSVEKFFEPLIAELPHLDDDIQANILRKKEAFAEIANQLLKGNGDIEQASELSWGLRDAILKATAEQEAREANRAREEATGKAKARRKKEETAVEQSREANLRHRREQEQLRSGLADKFAKALAL